jgi:hypothetical protein
LPLVEALGLQLMCGSIYYYKEITNEKL